MLFTLTRIVFLSLLLPSSSFTQDIDTFLSTFNDEAKAPIRKHLNVVEQLVRDFSSATKKDVINSELQGWMAQKVNESLKYGAVNDKRIRNIRAKAMLLQQEQWKELKNVSLEMLDVYMGKICVERNATTDHCVQQWELYPTLRRNFANSRNEAELRRYWKEWYHVKTNDTVVLSKFERMVKLYHNGSVSMNYTGIANRTEDQYRSDVLTGFSLEKWENESFFKLLPLYEELHAYAKHHLEREGDKRTIGAHLVGDLFAESWQNIYLTNRHPTSHLNYTAKLKEKFHNQADMLKRCVVEYFGKIGFNNDAICKGDDDSNCEVSYHKGKLCRPTTLVFPDDEEDWMSMCAEVEMDDLNDMFVLVGRLLYGSYYKKEAVYFQHAANPGMLDSLGKAVALAFNSPFNLNKSGLINVQLVTEELQFEHLYKQALITIPSMMHAFAVDTWLRHFLRDVPRMKAFNWTYLNEIWWKTLENYTGVSRPSFEHDYPSVDFLQVPRVAMLEPIGREFFSTAFSYQLFESFCDSAVSQDSSSFHQCYINGMLRNIGMMENLLSDGSSRDWVKEINLIGQDGPSVEPLLRYFRPLHDKLAKMNNDSGLCRGWGVDDFWTKEFVMLHLSPVRCEVSPPTPTESPKDNSTTTTAQTTPSTDDAASILQGNSTLHVLFTVRNGAFPLACRLVLGVRLHSGLNTGLRRTISIDVNARHGITNLI
ncbi:dipeptidyl carboxydipeptidase family protein [Trichuris suis]|nr:dipeptidyl carboxydipeptidase family protein [Trichuris suis]